MARASTIVSVAAVPAILALGGLWWLTFGERVHTDIRHGAQEDRAALAVKAERRPQNKIKVFVSDAQTSQFQIDTIDQDGGNITFYVRNVSHKCIPFVEAHYQSQAPDGTIVASDHEYQSDYSAGLRPHQRYEFTFTDVPEDDRVKQIEVWVSGNLDSPCD